MFSARGNLTYRAVLLLTVIGLMSLFTLTPRPAGVSAAGPAAPAGPPSSPTPAVAARARPSVPQCSYCLSPSTKNISSEGGPGTLDVAALPGCAWAATTNDPWITINNGSGNGNGTVTYTVAANPANTPRAGTIMVAGETAAVTQGAACVPRPPGLAGWWPGEGNAVDYAGSNHGMLQGGVAFSSAQVERGFRFDGVNDAVSIPDSASHKPANVTVEAWVRFDALDTPGASAPGLQYLVFKKNSRTSFFEGYTLFKSREAGIDRLRFTITSVAGVQAHTFSTTAVATGQFYHVVGTYDGSHVKLYVNGVLEGQTPASFPLDYGTQPLFFGTSGAAFNGRLQGLLDEVSVYSRALADAEIAALFNAGVGGKCRWVEFADVPQAHPFYREIRRLSALQVTRGCTVTTYCPEQAVTREQMAVFIIRALGFFDPPMPAQQRFTDVPPTRFGYRFIEVLAQLGITLGCTPTQYCPDDPVTREQMAAFLIRALGVLNPPPPQQQRFTDVPPSNPFYAFIDELARRRITLGCAASPPLYCPTDSVTRGQMAAFLTRAFDTTINSGPAVSAGPNQTVWLPSLASLNGLVSDDGLPECGALTVQWSQASGPGVVTFGSPNALTTTASFSAPGTYVLRLTATDGQVTRFSEVTVTVNPVNPNNQPPVVSAGADQVVTLPSTATLNGTATDDGVPGGGLTLAWTKVSGPGAVIFSNASAAMTTATFATPGSYVLRLSASDSQLTSMDEVTVTVNADPTPTPPDPAMVAPPLDRTVTTTVGSATEFLYSGPDPIQTGVAPGTIKMVQAAVLRGRVLKDDGTPLPNVLITILGHPEFGQTRSRADGRFDMAVNGGGPLTVQYEKVGFMPLQRQMEVPWQDYCMYPDVMMKGFDPQVTHINLSAGTPIQVAQGSPMNDADGARRAALLFRQGTTATMHLPGGGTQPLTNLHVRATEYTVGPDGEMAMPGDLPPTSAYTYAADFSIDEAVAAGATSVSFSQPLIQYLENFLDFPVGTDIPVGFYDRQRGAWETLNNGRVVKILTVASGAAILDVTGNGLPASDAEYTALGISLAERQTLATLYASGRSLWRVLLPHFTAVDANWPGAGGGSASDPNGPPPDGGGNPPNKPDCGCGSIIGIQGQTLGEAINLVGTPFTLHYSSDRTPGRQTEYSITIPLSGPTVPPILRRIDLEVNVAGQTFKQSFPAAPNQSTTFTWNGQDAYGRAVQGKQTATVTVGFVYNGVYYNTVGFGYTGNGVPLLSNPTRREVTFLRRTQLSVGAFDARAQGLGGWSLDVQHVYDPVGRTLYTGDGRRRRVESLKRIIITAAGVGSPGFSGDGGPAHQAAFNFPEGLDFAPDGSAYIADVGNRVVRRIAPNGIVNTVAGTPGTLCNPTTAPCGDGGPASAALLHSPVTVAFGPDGSYYILDPGANRLRKVAPNGIITTVAGTGVVCPSPTSPCGDGGPATQAQINNSQGVFVAPDGTIYLGDTGNRRIRRIGTDGIIDTIAGNGQAGGCPVDGVPARQACLGNVFGVVAAPDGSIYFSERQFHRLFRLTPDGILHLIAGNGSCGSGGDGGPAGAAQFCNPEGISRGPDGSLYIADWANGRIRQIDSNGIINTIAGTGVLGYSGDGGAATSAQIRQSTEVKLAPDGGIWIADLNNHRVRRVFPPLPGFTSTDIAIPSEDGGELYQFDGTGRHLRTVNTLTGANRYVFNYDGAGRLLNVVDGDNNTTTIQRDGSGNPTGILSPFNQLTALTLSAGGYISQITDPASQSHQFVYNAGGLMTQQTTPRGHSYSYTYDALGRLTRDDDPAGGFKTLARTEQGLDYTLTLNTALGLQTTYQVQTLSNGDQRRLNTPPHGLQTNLLMRTNGTSTFTTPDGMVTNETLGPDLRWRMQAPLTANRTITTPSNLSYTETFNRTVILSNPADPLSLATQTDTLNINGRTYTSIFNASTRTFTDTTPVGRQTTTTIDSQGRVTQHQFANLNPASYTYDAQGRLLTASFGTGVEARVLNFTYNSNGSLATVTDPLNRVTSFAYDAAGWITQQAVPGGQVTGFGHDAAGNLTSFTPPGRPIHTFAFTPVDLVSSYTAPLVGTANQTVYAYNLDRQLTTITRPDNQTLTFGYGVTGRLSTLTIPGGQYTYSYNPTTGNLSTITAPGGTLSYIYDGALLTRATWAGTVIGNVSHTYDNFFRIVSQSVNDGSTIIHQYDNDNLLISAGNLTLTRSSQSGLIMGTVLGGVSDALSYNGFGELIGYSAAFNGAGIYSNTYTRDKLARITQKTETIGAVMDTYGYTYDVAGRLTGVSRNGVTISTYTYDNNGNRLNHTGPGGAVNGAYDAQDRLIQYGAAVYTYTANGELSSKTMGGQTTMYQYDVLGNLRSVTFPGGTQIEYIIDGRNRRIAKRVNGVLVQGFLYQDRLKPVAELDGSNQVVSRFVYASRFNVPDYMIRNGRMYRILSDHLGSPRLVVDVVTGAIAQRIDYDEFGNVTQDTNPGFQPFGFAGGLYDPQTKLTRFGVRDYDAETGRWTAKDPILFGGGDANLYSYVLADPQNALDYNGFKPTTITVSFYNIRPDFGDFGGPVFNTPIPGGHVSISTGNGPSYGFYPGGVKTEGTPGTTRGTPDRQYKIIVDEEIAKEIQKFIDEKKQKGDPYDPLTNNCSKFVVDALDAGGIPAGSGTTPLILELVLKGASGGTGIIKLDYPM